MLIGFLFARPILVVFGASQNALTYAYPYIMIYLIGTIPSMISIGMNPFINAQGYSRQLACFLLPLELLQTFCWILCLSLCLVSEYRELPLRLFFPSLSAAFVLFFLTRKSEMKAPLSEKNRAQKVPVMQKTL